MSQTNRSSYAVIPSYILEDDDLDEGAKVLYGRISMYSQDGRCWATNKHFSEKHKVDPRTIQRWLTQLKDAGYIEVDVDSTGFQTTRDIWITNDFKKHSTKRHICHPPTQSISPTPDTYVVSSNKININKTNINEEAAAIEHDMPSPIAAAEVQTSIIFKNTKGEACQVSESDVFAYFLKLPYSTSEIQAAIARLKESNDFVGNVFKYLEAICLRIHNSKSLISKDLKKKDNSDIPDLSHLPRGNFGELLKSAKDRKNET